MSTLYARLWGCLGTVSVASLLALTPAYSQQTCQEIDAVLIWCPQISEKTRISGEPPNCFCDGVPIEPPLELTCERNFGCPDATFVGEGDFPECRCRQSEGTGSVPGGPPPVDPVPVPPGLGGTATCDQFFECPQGAEMVVEAGQCLCEARYAPEFKE